MTLFGLGNPTDRYQNTRHNVGFMVVDEIAGRRRKFKHEPEMFIARGEFGGEPLRLVKPLTYMNNSGVVVREQLARKPDSHLVVCDDLALPFGRLRIRPAGSDGGHNGLGSIVYHLGSERFPRLRIGIDAAPAGVDAADYVLEPFSEKEREQLPGVVARAADACFTLLTKGMNAAMNEYNPDPDAEPVDEKPPEDPA